MNRNSQTNNHSKQQSSQCKKKPGCRQLVSLSPFPQPLLFFGLSERFFFREASNGNLILKLRAGNWSVVVATKIVGQVWFHTSSLSCYSFCHFFYCTQFSLSFDLHWVCFEICNIVVGKWISNGRLISSSGINSPRQLKLDLVGWVSGLVGGWVVGLDFLKVGFPGVLTSPTFYGLSPLEWTASARALIYENFDQPVDGDGCCWAECPSPATFRPPAPRKYIFGF